MLGGHECENIWYDGDVHHIYICAVLADLLDVSGIPFLICHLHSLNLFLEKEFLSPPPFLSLLQEFVDLLKQSQSLLRGQRHLKNWTKAMDLLFREMHMQSSLGRFTGPQKTLLFSKRSMAQNEAENEKRKEFRNLLSICQRWTVPWELVSAGSYLLHWPAAQPWASYTSWTLVSSSAEWK